MLLECPQARNGNPSSCFVGDNPFRFLWERDYRQTEIFSRSYTLSLFTYYSTWTNVLEEADASIFVGVQIQLGAKLAVHFIRAACQMIEELQNPPCPRHRSISVTVQNRESDIHIFKHNPTLIHPHALSINFKP